MATHRFLNQLERSRLPEPPAPQPTPDTFMALPQLFAPLAPWQCAVYRRAFELAQAVSRQSLPERNLLGTWN